MTITKNETLGVAQALRRFTSLVVILVFFVLMISEIYFFLDITGATLNHPYATTYNQLYLIFFGIIAGLVLLAYAAWKSHKWLTENF